MSLNDIKNMPTAQKIHLMEALWDSLSTNDKELETPLWHKKFLEQRAKKLEEGNVKTYMLDKLKVI